MFDGGFFHGYAMMGWLVFIGFLIVSIIQSIIWYKVFEKKILFFVSLIFLLVIFFIFDLDIAFSLYAILLVTSIIVLILFKNKKQK